MSLTQSRAHKMTASWFNILEIATYILLKEGDNTEIRFSGTAALIFPPVSGKELLTSPSPN